MINPTYEVLLIDGEGAFETISRDFRNWNEKYGGLRLRPVMMFEVDTVEKNEEFVDTYLGSWFRKDNSFKARFIRSAVNLFLRFMGHKRKFNIETYDARFGLRGGMVKIEGGMTDGKRRFGEWI